MKREEPKKEVSFITVINFIAGIFLLFLAIGMLAMSKYFLAILFFLLVVFIFLPQKILKINKWFKLLIVVIGFFVGAFILGVNLPSSEPKFEYYNLNEEFILNFNNANFSMTITKITKEDKIVVNDEERTTEGIFLLVHGDVTNLGKIATDFGFYSGLNDNQNNSYSVISFSFDEGALQPNLKRDFFNVFEIQKDASGLEFSVGDDTNLIRVIDLGI
ncbi:hypothetical protein KAJ87_00805 [Candidatus Pacearchaeota archaeon]|nr:hypothetical protein [Candidatus Pacearchaeota archaeon]